MLCGYDPYANSKSCSELVTYSYRNSFFKEKQVPVTTMRAGNVIGGGDFAKDRIIPDCVRAAIAGEDIIVRNPYSIRPYQHVLEPVICYLSVAAGQYNDPQIEGCYNVGPDDEDALSTAKIATMFCEDWNDTAREAASGAESNKNTGEKVSWINRSDRGPHEDNFLKLDCTKIKETLGWHPVWDMDRTMRELVKWYKAYSMGNDLRAVTRQQIEDYISCLRS
jgi:CDP-glucose 4,6-dehydratase